MATETYLTPSELSLALTRAIKEPLVVAGLYTSEHCPFCIALKREQLTPRMRSANLPRLVVIEFDADRNPSFIRPSGQKTTVADWAKSQGFKLMPTLFMLDRQADSIGKPLVGYASRDFFGAYLEEQIKLADEVWKKYRAIYK